MKPIDSTNFPLHWCALIPSTNQSGVQMHILCLPVGAPGCRPQWEHVRCVCAAQRCMWCARAGCTPRTRRCAPRGVRCQKRPAALVHNAFSQEQAGPSSDGWALCPAWSPKVSLASLPRACGKDCLHDPKWSYCPCWHWPRSHAAEECRPPNKFVFLLRVWLSPWMSCFRKVRHACGCSACRCRVRALYACHRREGLDGLLGIVGNGLANTPGCTLTVARTWEFMRCEDVGSLVQVLSRAAYLASSRRSTYLW